MDLLHNPQGNGEHPTASIFILASFQQGLVLSAKADYTRWEVDVAVDLYQVGCMSGPFVSSRISM